MSTITTSSKNNLTTSKCTTNNIICYGCLTFGNTETPAPTWYLIAGNSDIGDNSEIFNTYIGTYKNVASGNYSHAEGRDTTASGNYSHAEGNGTKAEGNYSHAEGNNTTASGENSHAEGNGTTASGRDSHAEGYGTTASGDSSHAEGYNTTASGHYSHAEGYYTSASGYCSHAQNYYTIADYNSMTAIGNYNISNTNEQVNKKKNKLFVIGNGTELKRQDAFIITDNGDVFVSGNVFVKGNVKKSIGNNNWVSNDYNWTSFDS